MKIQVSLKSDKDKCTVHVNLFTFVIISFSILLRMRNISDKVVEKTKSRMLLSVRFSRKSCRLWDNAKTYDTDGQATDDNIIWRMRFACWITGATHTNSKYMTVIAFPRQQKFREHALTLRLLMSHIYGAPSKARNVNVVYIWTYVWQRW